MTSTNEHATRSRDSKSTSEVDAWVRRDQKAVWHPLTQHQIEGPPLPVVGASGSTLQLADGRRVLDAISSWWSCLHGHGRPEIAQAVADQAAKLDHVMFAGFTHPPAVELAERLVKRSPPGLSRVFFSDNGSTAIEVALKMAWQRWIHEGATERQVFVTLEGSYHGDTVGAMSVGDPDPYFVPFQAMTFTVERATHDAQDIEERLINLGSRAAGVIIEPLVQGAAGMVMHPPALVRSIRESCDRHGVPLIADEVMTGFGRTGTLFACEQAGITPDYLCLSKGLTGGTLPLSVTMAREESFEAFLSEERTKAFFHGHTYTGNPIACAAALASFDLVDAEDTPNRLDKIGRRIEAAIRASQILDKGYVRDLRRVGGIVAFDLAMPDNSPTEGSSYFRGNPLALRRKAVESGVLLRPLGPVLYAMPPSCTTEEECDRIAEVMIQLATPN